MVTTFEDNSGIIGDVFNMEPRVNIGGNQPYNINADAAQSIGDPVFTHEQYHAAQVKAANSPFAQQVVQTKNEQRFTPAPINMQDAEAQARERNSQVSTPAPGSFEEQNKNIDEAAKKALTPVTDAAQAGSSTSAAPGTPGTVRGDIPKADQEANAQQRKDMLPTVDSVVPGRVETNPNLSAFPNVKGSYYDKDGNLVLIVDKLPTRERTPEEIDIISSTYGPAYGGTMRGATGASLGAMGFLAGPVVGSITTGVGLLGGYLYGRHTGKGELAGDLKTVYNQQTPVKRYGIYASRRRRSNRIRRTFGPPYLL